MTPLEIISAPVLDDNYVHLIHDPKSGATAAVDPAVADPVLDALNARDWRLSHILITHHHYDHTGGVAELAAASAAKVIGAAADQDRLPKLDMAVNDGDQIALGDHQARVIAAPGHTRAHIAYWFDGALFCGDTLFSLGCGRLFEGTAAQMWASLLKLRALPDDTLVYCAHEYTAANAAFALSVDPDNQALKTRAAEVTRLRQHGRPTIPSLLASEKAANPFLRADVIALQQSLNMTDQDPEVVFAHLRSTKDRF